MAKKQTTAKEGAAAKLAPVKALSAKHQQIIGLLMRDCGASIEEMAVAANWLAHSTRAFLSGLKKKGYAVDSEKVEGVRRYRARTMLEAAL